MSTPLHPRPLPLDPPAKPVPLADPPPSRLPALVEALRALYVDADRARVARGERW